MIVSRDTLRLSGTILLVLGVFFLSVQTSALALWHYWRDTDNYSHGILIPFMAIGCLTIARRRLPTPPSTEPHGLLWAALIACVGVWFLARVSGIQLLELASLPAILYLLFVANLGVTHARALLFPFAFLYFAIPGWDFLNPLLQWLTTSVAGATVKAIGIPAHIVGNHVTIPEGRFEVAGGCSGLKYFLVTLALMSFYCFQNVYSHKRSLLILSISIGAALITNWIRVTCIILVGHYTNMTHSLISDHKNFGWYLFAVVFPLLLLAARRIATSDVVPTSTTMPEKLPVIRLSTASGLALGLTMLGATSTLYDALYLNHEPKPRPTLALPMAENAWTGPTGTVVSPIKPQFKNASSHHQGTYQQDNLKVILDIYYFDNQHQNKEVVSEDNYFVNGDVWHLEDETPRALPFSSLPESAAIRTWIGPGREGIVQVSWYYSAGLITSRPRLAQLYYLRSLWNGDHAAAAIAISSKCLADCDKAREAVTSFLIDHEEALAALR